MPPWDTPVESISVDRETDAAGSRGSDKNRIQERSSDDNCPSYIITCDAFRKIRAINISRMLGSRDSGSDEWVSMQIVRGDTFLNVGDESPCTSYDIEWTRTDFCYNFFTFISYKFECLYHSFLMQVLVGAINYIFIKETRFVTETCCICRTVILGFKTADVTGVVNRTALDFII